MFIFSFEINIDSSKFSKKSISYSYKGCIWEGELSTRAADCIPLCRM